MYPAHHQPACIIILIIIFKQTAAHELPPQAVLQLKNNLKNLVLTQTCHALFLETVILFRARHHAVVCSPDDSACGFFTLLDVAFIPAPWVWERAEQQKLELCGLTFLRLCHCPGMQSKPALEFLATILLKNYVINVVQNSLHQPPPAAVAAVVCTNTFWLHAADSLPFAMLLWLLPLKLQGACLCSAPPAAVAAYALTAGQQWCCMLQASQVRKVSHTAGVRYNPDVHRSSTVHAGSVVEQVLLLCACHMSHPCDRHMSAVCHLHALAGH